MSEWKPIEFGGTYSPRNHYGDDCAPLTPMGEEELAARTDVKVVDLLPGDLVATAATRVMEGQMKQLLSYESYANGHMAHEDVNVGMLHIDAEVTEAEYRMLYSFLSRNGFLPATFSGAGSWACQCYVADLASGQWCDTPYSTHQDIEYFANNPLITKSATVMVYLANTCAGGGLEIYENRDGGPVNRVGREIDTHSPPGQVRVVLMSGETWHNFARKYGPGKQEIFVFQFGIGPSAAVTAAKSEPAVLTP